MSSQDKKSREQIINYVEDLVGADIPRDLIKVAVVASETGTQSFNIESVSGQDVTPSDFSADVSSIITELNNVQNSQGDAYNTDIKSARPEAKTDQIASTADISSGVTQQIVAQNFTVYVENTGASSSDITLSYSPDGASTFLPDPDGVVTVSNGSVNAFEIGYDATHVQVSASNTEPFNVYVVQR